VLFFYFGINKIVHTPQMQAYMVNHNSHVPTNLIYLAIVTQIVPPALVLLGYKTRYGALALSGFCIIATTLFHSDFGNPSEVAQFLLDFAIAGGLLFMFAYGPGPLSLDAFRWRAKPEGKTQETLSGQA
jgi:putative oxidoreductase